MLTWYLEKGPYNNHVIRDWSLHPSLFPFFFWMASRCLWWTIVTKPIFRCFFFLKKKERHKPIIVLLLLQETLHLRLTLPLPSVLRAKKKKLSLALVTNFSLSTFHILPVHLASKTMVLGFAIVHSLLSIWLPNWTMGWLIILGCLSCNSFFQTKMLDEPIPSKTPTPSLIPI